MFMALVAPCLCAGCARKAEKRDPREIIEEMAADYGSYGDEAKEHVKALLKELKSVDADAVARWENIMKLRKAVRTDLTVYDAVL